MAPAAITPDGAEDVQYKAELKTNGKSYDEEKHTETHTESHNQIVTTNTKTTTTYTTKTEEQQQFASDQQVIVLRDCVGEVRRRFISEYSHVDEHYIDSLTIRGFLDYIEQERLMHMPHQGSKWDKVLKWAEFFALQVEGYERAVSAFVPGSGQASKLIWASSRILLDLGHENAQALKVTFSAFYKLGLSVSFFLRNNALLCVNAHLRNEVGHAFKDLLILVSDAAVTYRNKICNLDCEPVTLNFNVLFGQQMKDFHERKNHIINAMWEYQLGNEAALNIGRIRKWLRANDKRCLEILYNRREALDYCIEYTCEWFQRYLLDFSCGKKDCLLVTGPEGCGKSVLSGWIIERLQRLIAKKTFVTLSYSLHIDLPTESTSLAIAKSLALQLLETDVSDKVLFEKLFYAYNLAATSCESGSIENELWEALEIGLKNFDASSDSLMIVIDGLDEVGESAQAVLSRLETLSKNIKNLQTIILARTMPTTNATTQVVEIKMDHTHQDMERVVEYAFKGYTHLEKENQFDREKIVEQIVHDAQGNFIWATLVVTLLKKEQAHAAFYKALKEIPKNLPELLKKIISTLDQQKQDTKLLLQWLLVAQRPLTLTEVKCLLQVDLQKICIVDRKTDIREDIYRACGLLVDVNEGVVAYRHGAIRGYLGKMMAEKTYLLPLADAHQDITLRILMYCKLSLTKSLQCSITIPDTFDVEEIFRAHGFIEYYTRYWIPHFRFSPLYRVDNALQLSAEIKAIFPHLIDPVLLEWKCWEYQMSISQAVEWHNIALRIREACFTQNHEAVLQTLIVCGHFRRRVHNIKEACSCFYRASRIGQDVLTKYHGVTFACTAIFLELTETITSKTRTEIITQKEEMLKYIIAAYKHEYEGTSEVVERYLKVLAQLYIDIHEECHAEMCWRELREIMIIRHGLGSGEEREILDNFSIPLKGHGRDLKELKGPKGKVHVEYEASSSESISDELFGN